MGIYGYIWVCMKVNIGIYGPARPKRPKMARFGVQTLFGPRPLPILPRAGVESKKGAKCDIIRRHDAKKGSPKQKNELWSKITFFLRVFFDVKSPETFFLL